MVLDIEDLLENNFASGIMNLITKINHNQVNKFILLDKKYVKWIIPWNNFITIM